MVRVSSSVGGTRSSACSGAVVLRRSFAPASGSLAKTVILKIVEPKDHVQLAFTSVIVWYAKRPAHTITIGSVSVIMPTANSDAAVDVGPSEEYAKNLCSISG
jgi:hypothetical protein